MSPTQTDTQEEILQLRSRDGTALTVRRVRPRGEVRARLAWIHGVAEHGGRYLETLRHFAERGFDSAVIDLRGHGTSGGRRVFVNRWGEYLDDSEVLFEHLSAEGETPMFAIGHSMGGLVLTRTLQERLGRLPALAGAVILSPFFGLKMQLPIWKEVAGRAMSRVAPWFAMPTDLDVEHLSKDPAVGEAYLSDPLISHKATSRWFTEAVAQHELVQEQADLMDLPVLVMHGEDDQITCVEATKSFFGRVAAADKELKLWGGCRHELLNEEEKADVRAHLQAWLEQRLG